MAEEKKEAPKKEKRLSAKKSHSQSVARNLQNRAFKSSLATAIRSLQESPKPEAASLVFSLLDKGVKKNIIKANKASRLKSRIHARTAKA